MTDRYDKTSLQRKLYNLRLCMLYRLLEQIQKKPSLYINAKSVANLDVFLLGFAAAKSAYQLPLDDDEKDFTGFRDWIAAKYHIHSNQSWAQIIRFFARDDEKSLELFFELLAEYRNRRSYENVLVGKEENYPRDRHEDSLAITHEI